MRQKVRLPHAASTIPHEIIGAYSNPCSAPEVHAASLIVVTADLADTSTELVRSNVRPTKLSLSPRRPGFLRVLSESCFDRSEIKEASLDKDRSKNYRLLGALALPVLDVRFCCKVLYQKKFVLDEHFRLLNIKSSQTTWFKCYRYLIRKVLVTMSGCRTSATSYSSQA